MILTLFLLDVELPTHCSHTKAYSSRAWDFLTIIHNFLGSTSFLVAEKK